MGFAATDVGVWLRSAALLGGAVAAGLLAHWILYSMARRVAKRTEGVGDDSLVRRSSGPVKLILPLLTAFAVSYGLDIGPELVNFIRHTLALALIGGFAWLCVRMLYVVEDVVTARYSIEVQGDIAARRIRTQVEVLRRIAVVLIGIIAFAAMLMTFPDIWNIGAGLFASAGVAGLIIGMAARPTLSNLLAGIQIALTQPIRLGDVVIVENEWGVIEEIGAAYVVVRIWDQRRLVVPLSYFIERPFQNWTRKSSELLGTAFFYVDYSVPVEEVRSELQRILESTDLWDRRAWNLQVTNTTEKTVELRAMVSAANAGDAWDLRCLVRERLVAFLQERYPQSLPRTRTEVMGEGSQESGVRSQESGVRSQKSGVRSQESE